MREVEDGESKWEIRLKEDRTQLGEWKKLGVDSIREWCNKVKDRCWLASKLKVGRNKRKGKKKTKGK